MKVKNSLKILVLLAITLLAICLFIPNTVRAESTNINIEKINNDIDWIGEVTAEQYTDYPVYENEKEVNYDYGIYINLNENNYSLQKFKEIQNYLKNNNINTLNQKVKIEIPNDVKAVKDKSNKQYSITEIEGKKYIELDLQVAKVFKSLDEVIKFYEDLPNTSLEYTTTGNKTKKCYISYFVNDVSNIYGHFAEYSSVIADENKNYQLEKFKVKSGTLDEDDNWNEAYAVSGNRYIPRAGGWDDWFEDAMTNMNYLNTYIYITIPYNNEKNITGTVEGTNKKVNFEFYKDESDEYNKKGIYRTKIDEELEKLLFSKPQTTILSCEVYNSEFELPHKYEFKIRVSGTARTSVKVNDDSEVKIDFDGVLPTGVTVKADEIKQDTELYATITSTGINTLKSKYNVNTLTHLILTELHAVGGEIEGAITLTFNVGTQYNGKYVYIVHQKQNKDFEYFRETVKDGKVSIVVEELSPFMVAVEEKISDPNTNTNTNTNTNNNNTGTTNSANNTNHNLDETPKTGEDDTTIAGILPATGVQNIAVMLLVISIISSVFLYKNMKKY